MQQDDYTLIEKYLEGTLENGDVDSFRRRIQEDAEFAEAYTVRKSMDIFLEKEKNQPRLAEKLETLGKEFFQPEAKTRIVPLWRKPSVIAMVAAAAIALLLMVWNPFKPASLYEQYAVHQPLSLIEKSTAAEDVARAQAAFNDEKYEQAYQELMQIVLENPQNLKTTLYLGIAALETGKTGEATRIFSTLQEGNSAYKHYGTWYLALTYLKLEDFEKTKVELAKIPESDKLLYGKAEALLKKLK